ncbi:MAG: hypothetical protein Aurels2KO_19300 [Aureliella sp.]
MNNSSHYSGRLIATAIRRKSTFRRRVVALLVASSVGLSIPHSQADDRVAQAKKHSTVTPSWQILLEGYSPQRRKAKIKITPRAEAAAPRSQVPAKLSSLSQRQSVEPPVIQQASSPIDLVDQGGTSAQLSSFQVGGFEIACAAARKWAPAHALRARGATVVRAFCDEDESSRRTAGAINRFMHLQAAHQEDLGAGTALRAYYTRIVLAQQLGFITEALELSDEEQGRLSALLEQGVASGVDSTQFARKRIDLLDQAAQLDSQDQRLSKVLEHLTDFPFSASGFGFEALEVRGQTLNCDGLVEFAFCNRHDLQSWVYLRSQVNQETAPVIAKMLSTVTGGFALPLPDVSWVKDLLCRDRYAQLAADLKRELSCVIQTQRDWIEKTVLEKCSELDLAYQRIQFAQKTLASWDERLAQVERLSALGKAVPESVVAAKTERIRAQVELASRRLEAKVAEVELSEACGGITQRCCARQPRLITGNH